MITPEQLHQLQEPVGRRLLDDLRTLAPTTGTAIRIATRLRMSYPAELVTAAMEIAMLRTRAQSKFSRADRMWFTKPGLEQATSESIARYRARRFAGLGSVADLCCGIGGDLVALAKRPAGEAVIAVDRDPLHLAMAMANAAVYGGGNRIEFHEADVRDVDVANIEGVFIDPARRSERGRSPAGESEPPLDWCFGLVDRVPAVGIKAAPGIPHAIVPARWGIEMIALGVDLKEAMLWSPVIAQAATLATILADDGIHQLQSIPGDPVPIRPPEPGDIFLDPNPAITRAGLVEDLARLTGAVRIDDRIAFLVQERYVATPFARALRVLASEPWNEKTLRTRLRELDAGPIDIRRRGLAGDVDAITKRLRMNGARQFTIAMTRTNDRPWAVICEAILP